MPATNSNVSIATSSSSSNNGPHLGPASCARNVGSKILRTTANALGVGVFTEIGNIVSAFSDFCEGSTEYATKHANLVRQVKMDLNLATQAASSPQTAVDDSAIASLINGLEMIDQQAAQIEKLSLVLKKTNTNKISRVIYELEDALNRQKTDFTPEPFAYDEIPWKDITDPEASAHRFEAQDPTDQRLNCVKWVYKARWKNQNVVFVEYSGTYSLKKKRKLLMQDLRQCAVGKNRYVLELLGGATPTTNSPHPYVVFRAGGELSHVDFLRKTTSLSALMTFIDGAEQGSQYMFTQGVIYRDGVSVSHTGVATVHPPGIKLLTLTGKQSTKRWAGHIVGDIASEITDAALPLEEIHQVLDACDSEELENKVRNALVALTMPVKKKHILEIAELCKVPLESTWRCVTTPDPPDYIVRPASFGAIVGTNTGRPEMPFTRWIPIASRMSAMVNPKDCPSEWIDKITTRITFKNGSRPTFKDADIPLIAGNSTSGWLRQNVIRNAKGLNSTCRVVLNYWNFPYEKLKNYQAAFDEFLEEHSTYPPRVAHFARRVNLRFIFHLEPDQVTVPVYLHRQPGSQSPRHYWGFLSQFADPTKPPEAPISEIKISYQLDLLTALEGDSWCFRTDQEYDEEYTRIPGSWIA
ncbi:hypothetical protein FRC12_015356 [Ceratobasidium sp. 428]|nr:hypothetical protein FRC12_015356 [Ceratobasidium sp. 428]